MIKRQTGLTAIKLPLRSPCSFTTKYRSTALNLFRVRLFSDIDFVLIHVDENYHH